MPINFGLSGDFMVMYLEMIMWEEEVQISPDAREILIVLTDT
jgi:hypothetical protein